MHAQLREQLQRSLQSLTQFYQSMIQQIEETIAMLGAGASLDPRTYFDQYDFDRTSDIQVGELHISRRRFTVTFQQKACFLSNTNSFRLLALFVERVNEPISHDAILAEVWDVERPCEVALRSAVKVLRRKLRESGLTSLADAIDGSVPGHYRLQLF